VTAPYDESHNRHPAAALVEEAIKAEAEVEANAAERVVTFSDAVVAIAITLLALDLKVPDGAAGWTSSQVLHGLRVDWPEYLSFLISFLVIGNHWATHRRIFRYVARMNGVVGRLNMLWLLLMVLTPVGARLLAGSGGFGVRFGIYVMIQVIATACLMLMSREIVRKHLIRPDAPERARHPDMARGLSICITFLVSIPVAFATDSSWTFAVWAIGPLVTWVLRQIMANGRHTAGDATQQFGASDPRIRG
jgi:uncharacterized membrane protein